MSNRITEILEHKEHEELELVNDDGLELWGANWNTKNKN